MVSERKRIDTPQPATPEAVAEVFSEKLEAYHYSGPLGVGFPAVIKEGVAFTANNIDHEWIGRDVAAVFGNATGLDVTVINDADAAALAEVTYGVAAGVPGMVVTITFGTGIGAGLLVNGELVPNLELGQIELEGHVPAESYFSAKARRRDDLDWDEWGARANRYLTHVNAFLNPDLIVIGGGLTKHWDLFAHAFDAGLPLVPASMGNNAGLAGAALAASRSRTR